MQPDASDVRVTRREKHPSTALKLPLYRHSNAFRQLEQASGSTQ